MTERDRGESKPKPTTVLGDLAERGAALQAAARNARLADTFDRDEKTLASNRFTEMFRHVVSAFALLGIKDLPLPRDDEDASPTDSSDSEIRKQLAAALKEIGLLEEAKILLGTELEEEKRGRRRDATQAAEAQALLQGELTAAVQRANSLEGNNADLEARLVVSSNDREQADAREQALRAAGEEERRVWQARLNAEVRGRREDRRAAEAKEQALVADLAEAGNKISTLETNNAYLQRDVSRERTERLAAEGQVLYEREQRQEAEARAAAAQSDLENERGQAEAREGILHAQVRDLETTNASLAREAVEAIAARDTAIGERDAETSMRRAAERRETDLRESIQVWLGSGAQILGEVAPEPAKITGDERSEAKKRTLDEATRSQILEGKFNDVSIDDLSIVIDELSFKSERAAQVDYLKKARTSKLIDYIRKKRGITLDRIASEIGVDKHAVSHIIAFKRKLSIAEYGRIVALFEADDGFEEHIQELNKLKEGKSQRERIKVPGRKLAALRGMIGLSQTQLGELVKRDQTSLAQIENNKITISVKDLGDFIRIFREQRIDVSEELALLKADYKERVAKEQQRIAEDPKIATGRAIASVRTRNNISQATLVPDISQRVMSLIESGEREPSIDELRKIMSAFIAYGEPTDSQDIQLLEQVRDRLVRLQSERKIFGPERNVSQALLCETSGLSSPTVRKILTGDLVQINTLRKFIEGLENLGIISEDIQIFRDRLAIMEEEQGKKS